MDKKLLRKQYKAERDSISLSSRILYSQQMIEMLCASDEYKKADNILLYSSYASEVVLDSLFDKAIKGGKNVYYPLVDKKNCTISFYKVDAKEQLMQGAYGILEPNVSSECYNSRVETDICIVPGLAYDISGIRLGYGGGYYDRFLADFMGTSVGLVYDKLYVESIPHDKYDISVDIVYTEKGKKKLNG